MKITFDDFVKRVDEDRKKEIKGELNMKLERETYRDDVLKFFNKERVGLIPNSYENLLDYFEYYICAKLPELIELPVNDYGSTCRMRLEVMYRLDDIESLIELADKCIQYCYFSENPIKFKEYSNLFELIRRFVLVFDESPVSNSKVERFRNYFPNKYTYIPQLGHGFQW